MKMPTAIVLTLGLLLITAPAHAAKPVCLKTYTHTQLMPIFNGKFTVWYHIPITKCAKYKVIKKGEQK